MDNTLHLLGIAQKAGRLEVGEEPVGAAARARQARVILLACDALLKAIMERKEDDDFNGKRCAGGQPDAGARGLPGQVDV